MSSRPSGAAECDGNREPLLVTHEGGSATASAGRTPVELWAGAFERDPGASVHQHPDLVLAAAERAAGRPWLHVRWSGPAIASLAALVPKTLALRPLGGIAPGLDLALYRLVGNRLVGANDPQALEAFCETCAAWLEQRRTAGVYLEDVEVGSALERAVEDRHRRGRLAALRPEAPQPHWWIRFPPDAVAYWDAFSSKTRNTLRRKAKRLEHRVRRVTRSADVPGFVEQAHHVSRRSWQTRRVGLRIRDDAATRDHLTRLAARGALRCYVLEHAGVPVAFVIGSQWSRCYVYEEVAYDSSLAARSPGTVLLYEALRDLTTEHCPEVLDFGTGDAGYKRLFGNHRTRSGPIVLLPRGALSRSLALRLVRWRRDLTRASGRTLRRIGLYRAVRRWYRRGR